MHIHAASPTPHRPHGRGPSASPARRGAAFLLAVLAVAAALPSHATDDNRGPRSQLAASASPPSGDTPFEIAGPWPGEPAAPRDIRHDGFSTTRSQTFLDGGADDFAWEPTFFGPGLTREPMVATAWDDGSGPALYVGGPLLTAGRHGVSGIARWDGSAWTPLGIGVNGPVRAMTVYEGNLIVAGAFTQAASEDGDAVTVNHIARWDGSEWSPLDTGFPSPQLARVLAVTVYEGDLIAGGAWLPSEGQPTSWIARWDGSAWQPFAPGLNQAVWDFAIYDGDLVAGGSFTRAGGQVANGIARWDGSQWSPLGSGMNSAVIRLQVYDGDLIAGGGFTEAGGTFAGRVARWDGSQWSSLGSGLAGSPGPHVRDIGLFGDQLVVAGRFTHAGGQAVNHVARWNGSAWSPLAGPAGSGVAGLVWQGLDQGAVSTIASFDGVLIAGGEFYTAGGERANYIAQWDDGGWSPLPESGSGLVNFSRDNNASVRAITTYDGDLIVGGGFDDAGITSGAERIARWDGSQWSPLGSGIDLPFPGLGNEVNSLTVFDGALIVGGGFAQADGVPGTSRVARWDGSAWSALASGFTDGEVLALSELAGDLIAAGSFTAAGGNPIGRIARWDGSSWSPVGAGTNGTVNDLAVYDGDLVAAGSFTAAGGVAANRIARWDGTQWSPLGSGVDDAIWALAVHDGDLIAAGFFGQAGGVTARRIARWDGSSWSPVGGGLLGAAGGLSARATALTVFGGDLVVAGLFRTAGTGDDAVTVDNIARWDGERWWPLAGPFGVGTTGEPNFPWLFALASHDPDGPGPLPEKLAVGGFQLVAGGAASWGLGIYAPRALTAAPDPLDFGAVIVGESGGPLETTLTNNTDGELTVTEVSDPGAPFGADGGTCGAAPFTLAAGASCTLAFGFTPAAPGMVTAAVTITGDAPGGPRDLTLRGVGSSGALAGTPDPLDFGTVVVGQGAGPMSLTLINADNGALTVDSVSVPAAPFNAAGGSCGGTPFGLAPGASCTLDFTFDPTATGSFDDTVEVAHDGAGSPASFALTGDGVEPGLSLTPDPLDFGTVPLGDTAGPLSLTLANPGSAPVTVSALSQPVAPFAVADTTCEALPFSLAPGASCTFDYLFQPTDAGSASAAITVSSNAPTGPHTVTLQGDGTGAILVAEPESLSTTLPQGASETQSLTVANPGNATLEWTVTEAESLHGAILRSRGRVTAPPSAAPPTAIEGAGRAPGDGGTVSRPFVGPTVGTTITHSDSLDVAAGNTIACLGGITTLENHFLRLFALDDFGLGEGFHVQEVTFGVEFLDATVPVDVNLYTLDGELTFDNLTLVGGATVTLSAQELTLVTVPVTGFAPPGSTLVVEILPPHLGNLGRFFPGSNTLGETAPSYWAAPECGIPEPVSYGSAGWPGVHLVMTVTGGRPVDCALPSWVAVQPNAGSVPAGDDQLVDVTFDASDLEAGDYAASLCLESNDGARPLTVVPLTLNVTAIGAPELSFDPASLAFGDVPVGTTSPAQTAMLSNTGDAAASELTAMIDPVGSGFIADLSACGDTLPAGDSCPVEVTFVPVEVGPTTAALEIGSAEGATATAGLSGNGVGDEGFTPVDLAVDPPGLTPEANGLFEPGESVDVAPTWRNDGELAASLAGIASDFTGPEGAAYSIDLDAADYGLIEPDDTASCLDTEVCYRLGLDVPAARPAAHWDATLDETLDDTDGTTRTWTLHIGTSFSDVPTANPFYPAIETLLHSGVTGGCTAGAEAADPSLRAGSRATSSLGPRASVRPAGRGPDLKAGTDGRDGAQPLQAGAAAYCPGGANSRAQMPVFVLRALEGADYTPLPCVEDDSPFGDVPFDSTFCPWIQDLAGRGIVSGCGNDDYCPGNPVTRAQMAIFLLKTLEDAAYEPPACTERFTDVPCPSLFADWIEDLAARGITGGCAETEYCPADAVTRAQMAVFVTRTFGLTLYGP